ncbi:MAG: hypothetical protein SH850_13320 [Planctomycetaceae bacterium]|nr:hypothetical protein [Planctomycetaceae bacterium]
MSDPIVIELQRLASDGACPVDELLRKALIVATKLQINDFKAWIDHELTGYPSESDVPKYRVIQATLRVMNPVTGMQMPVFFEAAKDEDELSHFMAIQSVGEIQSLVSSGAKHLQSPFTSRQKQLLLQQMATPIPMECLRIVSASLLVGILNAVRNTVLDWSLRLEQQGILGEGMRFSSEEKAIAMTSQNIHIGSFQGILGDVASSTVTQKLDMTVTAGDFNSLQRTLTHAGVEASDVQALKQALAADPKPTSLSAFGPQTATWIGSMLTKAASGAWKVSLDTATKLLATSIAAYYGFKA